MILHILHVNRISMMTLLLLDSKNIHQMEMLIRAFDLLLNMTILNCRD